MAWLFVFFYFQTVYGIRIQTRCEGNDKPIALFGLSYFGFVVGSFVTLNHLMLTWGIILVSLNAAIIVRMDWNARMQTFEV